MNIKVDVSSEIRQNPTRLGAIAQLVERLVRNTCGVFFSHFLIHSQLIIARRQDEKAGLVSNLKDAQFITPSAQRSISRVWI